MTTSHSKSDEITARGMIELGDTFACAIEAILRERHGISRDDIKERPLNLLEVLEGMGAEELCLIRILAVALYATGHELDNSQRVATLAQARQGD